MQAAAVSTSKTTSLDDVRRRIRDIGAERDRVTAELRAIVEARKAGVTESAPISGRARMGQEIVRALTEGRAIPPLHLSEPLAREDELIVRRDAIDEVLLNLRREEMALAAAADAAWAASHAGEWLALSRELILTAMHMRALTDEAQQMVQRVPPGTGSWPLTNALGAGTQVLFESLDAAIEAATAKGILSQKDILC
jgi:hypothetical protein